MLERGVERLGAVSGALFVLVLLTATNIQTDHLAVIAAELGALLLLIPFVCFLSGVLRQAEGGNGWLSTTAVGAALIALAVKIASAPPYIVARSEGVSPQVQEAMMAMNNAAFMVTLLPLGIFMGAVAVVALRKGALPAWLGWFAALTAPLLLVNGMFLQAEFGPTFLLFLLWVLLTSALLTLRPNLVRQRTATQRAV